MKKREREWAQGKKERRESDIKRVSKKERKSEKKKINKGQMLGEGLISSAWKRERVRE